jgi:molecular chaperone HtpG
LPVPVLFGKKKEWKDGKQVETGEDNQINDTEPTWTKMPADLKDEDYRVFIAASTPWPTNRCSTFT